MVRISRIVIPDYPHHITQCGVRSIDVFNSDEDHHAYLSFLAEEAPRSGMEILAWCLMTNHVHFIAVPHKKTSLARGFGEAHRRYTRMKNFAQGVRGYLFQGRFSSSVLDEKHLLAAIRYIELDPVKANLAKNAWEYQWSSASFHAGETESDPLVTDRMLFGLITDWKDFLADGMNCGEADRIRKATKTGLPVGDDTFITRVADLVGRDLDKRKPGRPRKH